MHSPRKIATKLDGSRFFYFVALLFLSILCVSSEATHAGHPLPTIVVRFVLCFALFSVCFISIERFLCMKPAHFHAHPERSSWICIALYAAAIFFCWLPILLCLYPGVTFSDTAGQLCQYFGNPPEYGAYCIEAGSSFSDHHPITDTLIMGAIVQAGMLLGSANRGFMLLVVVQSILLALSISRLVCYLAACFGWSRTTVFTALLFFALTPMFPYMAASPVKDTIFIITFLNYVIAFSHIALANRPGLNQVFHLGVWTFLMILTKRTGLYVALLCLIGLLALNRKAWRAAILSLFPAIIAAGFIFPAALFPLLNVSPGSKNEMFGFFYQQTARYVRDFPSQVTPDERDAIDAILDFETLAERYNPSIVDPVNHGEGVDINPSSEKLAAYGLTFLAQLLKHPENNVKAILAQEAGWFDLSHRYQMGINYDMAIKPENGTPNITRPPQIRNIANTTIELMNNLSTLPVFGIICTPAVYTTLIPLFSILLGIRMRRLTKERIICMLPILASLPLLWISPVSAVSINLEAFRYTLPFLYTAPFTMSFALSRRRETLR